MSVSTLPSVLEALPNELKLEILSQSPDTKTLSALVHASPSYHALYAATRSSLFINIATTELLDRGVEVFTPCAFAEVKIRGAGSAEDLRGTMKAVHKRINLAVEGVAKTPPSENQGQNQAVTCFSPSTSSLGRTLTVPSQRSVQITDFEFTMQECIHLLQVEDFIIWYRINDTALFYRSNSTRDKRQRHLQDHQNYQLLVFWSDEAEIELGGELFKVVKEWAKIVSRKALDKDAIDEPGTLEDLKTRKDQELARLRNGMGSL